MKRIAIFGASGCGRGVMLLAPQQFVNLNEPCALPNGTPACAKRWLRQVVKAQRMLLQRASGFAALLADSPNAKKTSSY